MKVNYYLREDAQNSEGLCPIWTRSKINSESTIRKPTGMFCKPSKWGTKKKKNWPNGDTDLENKLVALKARIQDAHEELRKSKVHNPNLNDIWSKLFPDGAAKEAPTSHKIVDWIDHYLETSPYSQGYIRGVKLLRAHLTGKYMWKGKRMKTVKAFDPGLTFAELTQTKVDKFCRHLADQGKSTGTILKVIKFLKQVSKMARDQGIPVGTLDFKAPKNYQRKEKTEVRLTFDEVMKIQSVKIKDANHIVIRDLFLLQCFTGLSHVDLMKLSAEDIKDDYIQTRRQKTAQDVYVTLHRYSIPIINKYLAATADATSPLFPQFTQQFYNRTIKEVAELAGLTEEVKVIRYVGPREEISTRPKFECISSHTGRRTLARLLSQMGLSEDTIAEELGHNTRSITAHYIGGLDHQERIRNVQAAWDKAAKIFSPLRKVA